MKTLRIQYVDFYSSFNGATHSITDVLRRYFDVNVVTENPDLLVYSVWGDQHKSIRAKTKFFISGENQYPDFDACDYAYSTVRMDCPGRYLYRPYWISSLRTADLFANNTLGPELSKRKFCCFMYSNPSHGIGAIARTAFCQKLMQYKQVDCPGKVLHNLDVPELSSRYSGDWRKSKLEFIGQYKFIIAFENSDGNGYITEKLVDAYCQNVIPIYWGSTEDISPFPKESMIYAPDFPTLDALVDRVREIDADDELYQKMLEANPLRNPEWCKKIAQHIQSYQEFIRSVGESVFQLRSPYESRNTFANISSLTEDSRMWTELMPRKQQLRVSDVLCDKYADMPIQEASPTINSISFTQEELSRYYIEVIRKLVASLSILSKGGENEIEKASNELRNLIVSEAGKNRFNQEKRDLEILSALENVRRSVTSDMKQHYASALQLALANIKEQHKEITNPQRQIGDLEQHLQQNYQVLVLMRYEFYIRFRCALVSLCALFSFGKRKTHFIAKKKELRRLLRRVKDELKKLFGF